ncbi:MOSC domain-containing protein [Evansella sp. AB-P1]|uniref:MOSC domain-containing protein n=1 Tax=Evansella sp. AB-P1 TaxID=3037653 RepID=UPI00241EA121|nr:MOSC domain-containing protein [Evansella sp. AB-P1]MDG5786086.1 MOSC domain-containing protein [Evansella sp. AB-P1]
MKRLNANIISVNIGKPKELKGLGSSITTSIEKQVVDHEIFLSKLSLQGDEQADKINHGGVDKAVCVYPYEHYTFWEKELGRTLPLGAFGENLTIKGFLENDVHIGDVFQWGSAVVQVSQPRIPCHKLAKRYEVENMPQLVSETGYTGFYLRVLKEGTVSVDTPLRFIKRSTDISISYINHVFYQNVYDVESLNKIIDLNELASGWRRMLQKQLNKTEERMEDETN